MFVTILYGYISYPNIYIYSYISIYKESVGVCVLERTYQVNVKCTLFKQTLLKTSKTFPCKVVIYYFLEIKGPCFITQGVEKLGLPKHRFP